MQQTREVPPEEWEAVAKFACGRYRVPDEPWNEDVIAEAFLIAASVRDKGRPVTTTVLAWAVIYARRKLWRRQERRARAVDSAADLARMDFRDAMREESPGSILADHLERLHGRARQVMEGRARGDTLKAIGGRMGLTLERVRQIEAEAIKTMREGARG